MDVMAESAWPKPTRKSRFASSIKRHEKFLVKTVKEYQQLFTLKFPPAQVYVVCHVMVFPLVVVT